MAHTHIELDQVRGTKLRKALADLLRGHRRAESNAGTPWNELEIDSFLAGLDLAVINRAAPHPIDPPPDVRTPEIGILIDLDTLLHGIHEHSVCETYDNMPIPVSAVRRLCCDAEIIPHVLDGQGEVTDLGRSTRTVNRAQRRRLRAMHKTCIGPDCDVPFEQCEIHHIVFWRFNGCSDIDNLAPVCRRHHHLAHEGGWTLTMTSDRIVTWTRPDGVIHSTERSIDRAPHGVRSQPTTGPPPTNSARDPNRLIA